MYITLYGISVFKWLICTKLSFLKHAASTWFCMIYATRETNKKLKYVCKANKKIFQALPIRHLVPKSWL